MYDLCSAILLNGVCWKSNAQIMMSKLIFRTANLLHFTDYVKQFLEIRMLSFIRSIDITIIYLKAITLAELSI